MASGFQVQITCSRRFLCEHRLLRFKLAFQGKGLTALLHRTNQAWSPLPKVITKQTENPKGLDRLAPSEILLGEGPRLSPEQIITGPAGGWGPRSGGALATRRNWGVPGSDPPRPRLARARAPPSTVQPERRAEAGSPGPRVRPCPARGPAGRGGLRPTFSSPS